MHEAQSGYVPGLRQLIQLNICTQVWGSLPLHFWNSTPDADTASNPTVPGTTVGLGHSSVPPECTFPLTPIVLADRRESSFLSV